MEQVRAQEVEVLKECSQAILNKIQKKWIETEMNQILKNLMLKASGVDNTRKEVAEFHVVAKQEAQEQKNKLVQEIEEIDSASAQVCNRMKQIAATHAKMLHEKEQLDQLLGQQEKELTLLRKDVESKKELVFEEEQVVRKTIEYYEEKLGLRVQHAKSPSDNHIEITFVNIDSKNPDREFTIGLKIDSDRRISVADCVPMIPNIKTLEKTLNSTQDWHCFIVCVRKSFASLV